MQWLQGSEPNHLNRLSQQDYQNQQKRPSGTTRNTTTARRGEGEAKDYNMGPAAITMTSNRASKIFTFQSMLVITITTTTVREDTNTTKTKAKTASTLIRIMI